MTEARKTALGRRDFFKVAGLGAGAAGAAAVVMRATGAVAEQRPDDRPSKNAGYRETEHVKKFYDLARY